MPLAAVKGINRFYKCINGINSIPGLEWMRKMFVMPLTAATWNQSNLRFIDVLQSMELNGRAKCL